MIDSLDTLRAALTAALRPPPDGPLATRLGLVPVHVNVTRADGGGFALRAVQPDDEREIGSLTVEPEPDRRLDEGIRQALLPFQTACGARTDRVMVYWSFHVEPDRRGQAVGLQLAAVGAALAARRKMIVTGGAALRFISTSEPARKSYLRLARWLPSLALPESQTDVTARYSTSPTKAQRVTDLEAAIRLFEASPEDIFCRARASALRAALHQDARVVSPLVALWGGPLAPLAPRPTA